MNDEMNFSETAEDMHAGAAEYEGAREAARLGTVIAWRAEPTLAQEFPG